MRGFLLDTNVVSELMRTAPDPGVLGFVGACDDLWLSVVVLHELDFGVRLLPRGRRRDSLRRALAGVESRYRDRVLGVTRFEARQAARLRVQARRAGRTLHFADALIAATATVHDLAVATRNVRDFDLPGVETECPWTAQRPPVSNG